LTVNDFIVIGAGIAGASAAAELAAHGSVQLLEMESQPGYHTTGRSAAFFAASYGNRVVRGLTALSESFLYRPPDGFAEVELIRPRDCMFFGRPDQQASLQAMQEDNPQLAFRNEDEVRARVPLFKPGYLLGALHESRGGDLDVDALLQGFLRLLRRRGGTIRNAHEVTGMQWASGNWRVTAAGETFAAPVVVNASGAWADPVAELAGLGRLGFQPLLRSAMLIDPPDGMDIGSWPQMIDVDDDFYFKPDAGRILLSPADETPSAPCDAQADELELAVGVDRLEQATGLDIRRVSRRWGGLRTFAPDRTFVAGFDPRCRGFFWLAGQGGYGIQSAPSLAQLTAALITGSTPDAGFQGVLDYTEAVAPDRLL
jgi:D-arginine dehydrogenase